MTAAVDRAGTLAGRLTRSETLWALATVGVALLAGAAVIHLWSASLSVPFFGDGGDVAYQAGVVRDVISHGQVWTNPDLGPPLGQALYDFPAPVGDALNLVLLWCSDGSARAPSWS